MKFEEFSVSSNQACCTETTDYKIQTLNVTCSFVRYPTGPVVLHLEYIMRVFERKSI
jgi:hypothetical protein